VVCCRQVGMSFTRACVFGVGTALGVFTTASRTTCSQLLSAQAEQACIFPCINLDGTSNSRGWFQAIIPHLTQMSPYSPQKAKQASVLHALFFLSTAAIISVSYMLAVGISVLSHPTLPMDFIRHFDSASELRCLKVRCRLA